jgi:two-component system CheB/CheR fusion protein
MRLAAPHETWADFFFIVRLLKQQQRDLLHSLNELEQRSKEKAAALETLREVDRARRDFLSVLSHELRNPIAALTFGCELLRRARDDEKRAHAATVIRRQLEQLSRLVDGVLDIVRLEQVKIRLNVCRIDFADTVRETVSDFVPQFELRGIRVAEHLPEGPFWVDGDVTRLRQAISNVLQNALKFTPSGGTVQVSLDFDESEATLRVRDTGRGIAPDALEKLFVPFYQEEQPLDRGDGGLGLGLSVAKGLIELHGGSIRANSEGVGRGAELTIRLPRAPAPAGVDARPTQASRSIQTKRRVLVIEDNIDTGDTLKELMELHGWEVRVARDGREGVRAARSFLPDIVLCDIGLPKLNGYEVARSLRADDATRDTALVAMTGYALPDDGRRVFEAGFDHHLVKPARINAITEIVDRMQPRRGVGLH